MTLFIIGFGPLRFMIFVFGILLLIKIASSVGKKIQEKHAEIYRKFGTSEAISLAAQRYADGDISADIILFGDAACPVSFDYSDRRCYKVFKLSYGS